MSCAIWLKRRGHAPLVEELDAELTRRMAQADDSWNDSLEEGDWRLWAKAGDGQDALQFARRPMAGFRRH